MAPNNGIRREEEEEEEKKEEEERSRTSVLDPGVVESRGYGTRSAPNSPLKTKARRELYASKTDGRIKREISKEILEFLQGEGRFSAKAEARSFFTVWTFITRLPGPTWVDHHPGYLMRGMAYFPMAGAFVGLFTGAFFDICCSTIHLPPSIAACFSTAASLWVTGCFHEDGLADATDGIGGGWSKSQILKIMSDTRLGTYGCACLLVYLATKLQLLSNLGPSHWELFNCSGAGPALLVGHSLARWTAPYLIKNNDYIDEGGPKHKFYSFMLQAKHLVSVKRLLFATLTVLMIMGLTYGKQLWIAVLFLSVLLASVAAGKYARYLLGGVMGDYLGAAICVTEIVILTIILARNSIQSFFSSGGFASAFPKDLGLVLENEGAFSFARFSIIMLSTLLWCKFVGHPDVFVREVAVPSNSANRAASPSKGHKPKRKMSDNAILPKTLITPMDKKRLKLVNQNILCACLRKATGQEIEKDALHQYSKSYIASLIPRKVLNALLGKAERGELRSSCMETSRREKQSMDSNLSFSERYNKLQERVDSLCKPAGSLGTLEDWFCRLGSLQCSFNPQIKEVACIIWCGDHGIARSPENGGEGCSAYPQEVTRSIVEGLKRGVAGASVLSKANDVRLHVVDAGVTGGTEQSLQGGCVSNAKFKLEEGTRNCAIEAALSKNELSQLIQAGREKTREISGATDAIVLGEVGIGNTTVSSLMLCALTGESPERCCGAGATTSRTVDHGVVNKKIEIVGRALANYNASQDSPSHSKDAANILRWFGGAEITCIVGSILQASEMNLPVLIDGFIVSTAALVAAHLSPKAVRVYFLADSVPTEKGQQIAIDEMQKIAKNNGFPPISSPALSMGFRLGEGTGGLLAVPILQSACELAGMATLESILGKS